MTVTVTNTTAKAAMNRNSRARSSGRESEEGEAATVTERSKPRSVRVMTYNVHSFVGTDHVYDPERVARVIEDARADVVALQEVDFGRGDRLEPAAIERLAAGLQMRCHFTFTRDGNRGHFGNAALTRHDLSLVAEGSLPRRRDEARAVQLLRVQGEGFAIHLMNTHLSVDLRERKSQVRALLGAEWLTRAGLEIPLVVCGDFNSWPLSAAYRMLGRQLVDVQWGRSERRATWPSRLPFLRIDHIFVGPGVEVQGCAVRDSALARRASDHLPLTADLTFEKSFTARAATLP
jgi:endonuclease/exonuclease/phosphatase family metal-dependent hydrolase